MKKIILCLLIVFSFRANAQVNTLLDIPGRLQWDNNNGYCGENALLAIGLYYGNYISEYVGRNVAGGELLIASNDLAAFDALSFTYDEWDYNQGNPQYQNYLVWVKQHLYNKQPVIITVFIKGMNDPDYDHIIPAIGFNATNVNSYSASDELIYNSNFDSISFTRTFSSIYDTRSMNANGATYDYCIPNNVNYGCAITGVKDVQHVLKPVHLKIDSWDEPNVSLGEVPKVLHATITIDSLVSGQQYALMKYISYLNVPSSNFLPQNADSTIYFTASGTNQTFNTSFMSDTTVFYRCIPYANTGSNKQNEIPKWVRSGSIYHIRIRAAPRSSVSLTDEKIARALLNSTKFYHESGRWHCHLLLLMPDHLQALIAFPIDGKMSDILGAWKGFQC